MKCFAKILLKTWPYVVCIIAGMAFFIGGKEIGGDLKGLAHGIAGSFFAIPLLYFIYELAHNFSQNKLNKELFDYAKMQVDREILSIINQLTKVVQSYEK